MPTDLDHDLPLFRWTPPVCTIIPFPAVKRVGKIRRTAEVLDGKTGRDADHYWRQIVGGLRSQMEKASLPADTIDAELRSFFDAVKEELHRRSTGHRGGQRPGGDAA